MSVAGRCPFSPTSEQCITCVSLSVTPQEDEIAEEDEYQRILQDEMAGLQRQAARAAAGTAAAAATSTAAPAGGATSSTSTASVVGGAARPAAAAAARGGYAVGRKRHLAAGDVSDSSCSEDEALSQVLTSSGDVRPR